MTSCMIRTLAIQTVYQCGAVFKKSWNSKNSYVSSSDATCQSNRFVLTKVSTGMTLDHFNSSTVYVLDILEKNMCLFYWSAWAGTKQPTLAPLKGNQSEQVPKAHVLRLVIDQLKVNSETANFLMGWENIRTGKLAFQVLHDPLLQDFWSDSIRASRPRRDE